MNASMLKRTATKIADLDSILLVLGTALLLLVGAFELEMVLDGSASALRLLLVIPALVFGVFLLYITAARWARFVPAFMGLGALRALYSVVTGTMFSFPDRPFSRVSSASAVLTAGLAAVLSWRFVDHKPKGRQPACLVLFLVSAVSALFLQKHPTAAIAGVVVALSALAVARTRWGRSGGLHTVGRTPRTGMPGHAGSE